MFTHSSFAIGFLYIKGGYEVGWVLIYEGLVHHGTVKMRKALFIDRDGTINKDCPYCHDISQLVIYPDIIDIMKEYQKNGYIIVIITNQSGIGRGYFTLFQFQKFHNELLRRLEEKEIYVTGTYFCPHRPEEKCNCRKPGLELIFQAARELKINIKKSVIIGDRDDIEGEMGRSLGIEYKILKR